MTSRYQKDYILTDHALDQWEGRFGSCSIRASLAQSVPFGGRQFGGSEMRIDPTLRAVFCITRDRVVTTVLTESFAMANIQKNSYVARANSWDTSSVAVTTPAPAPAKRDYKYRGEEGSLDPEEAEKAKKRAIKRITSEYNKDDFNNMNQKEREKYIKTVLRESGVQMGKAYADNKSNVLYNCYRAWRGELVCD